MDTPVTLLQQAKTYPSCVNTLLNVDVLPLSTQNAYYLYKLTEQLKPINPTLANSLFDSVAINNHNNWLIGYVCARYDNNLPILKKVLNLTDKLERIPLRILFIDELDKETVSLCVTKWITQHNLLHDDAFIVTLVLGYTHFDIIKTFIHSYFSELSTYINSAKETLLDTMCRAVGNNAKLCPNDRKTLECLLSSCVSRKEVHLQLDQMPESVLCKKYDVDTCKYATLNILEQSNTRHSACWHIIEVLTKPTSHVSDACITVLTCIIEYIKSDPHVLFKFALTCKVVRNLIMTISVPIELNVSDVWFMALDHNCHKCIDQINDCLDKRTPMAVPAMLSNRTNKCTTIIDGLLAKIAENTKMATAIVRIIMEKYSEHVHCDKETARQLTQFCCKNHIRFDFDSILSENMNELIHFTIEKCLEFDTCCEYQGMYLILRMTKSVRDGYIIRAKNKNNNELVELLEF